MSRLPGVTWVLLLLLVVGIVLPLVGLRSPATRQTQAAQTPTIPGSEGMIASLRGAPARAIGNPRRAAVVSGIAFGRTENISQADSQMFRDSGLWHLLAASGQNIALVVALCIALARVLRAGRWLGLVWALFAIPAYVLIVGGGASIVRAGLMGELVVIAWLAGRLSDVRHLLLVSAVVLVWVWPGSWQSLGFQLSYACVLALLLWATRCGKWLRSLGLPHVLAEGVAATVICTLATAPLLMATVGSSPLLGGVANLIAVPLASLVLVVALPAALLEPLLPGVSHLGLAAAGYAAQLLLTLAKVALALPGARTTSPLVGYMVPFVCLVTAERRRLPLVRRWCGSDTAAAARRVALADRFERARLAAIRYCVAAAMCTCLVAVAARMSQWVASPSAAAAPPRPESSVAAGARVVVFDVGQGQSVLVADGDRGILLDVGPPGVDIARMTRAAGVDHVEGVVLTHNARDHVGGFPSVAASLHPPWVAEPAIAADEQPATSSAAAAWEVVEMPVSNIAPLCAGAQASVGAVMMSVVNPPCDDPQPGAGGDPNNGRAVAVTVSAYGQRVFVPSDAESAVAAPPGHFDAVVTAHHGSADDGLGSWLDSAQPGIAAISVGAGNSYGHPTASTLQVLRDHQVGVWRTDRDGTVTIALTPAGVQVRTASPWWCGGWSPFTSRCRPRTS